MVMSLAFVLFTNKGPGVIKSVLMLRSGKAWLHALGCRALAPHTVLDTLLIVHVFRIG